MLLEVGISGDGNAIKKEDEKILIYKDLIIEMQRMWNVKTKVIPVIIGATGSISKSLIKHPSNIPGKQEIKELQKTATLSTAHILQ
jgi:hypothetical protein